MTGILDHLAADAYHADIVADRPSLSASVAHILCSASPAHARAAHPRLGTPVVREEKAHFDIGTAAHALLLEGNDDLIHVVHADSWRTKEAKEMAAMARTHGRIPLLIHQVDAVEAMVTAAREQLAAHDVRLFTNGKAEQTLVWEEDGVACRSRLDWLRDDHTAIHDLKTTGKSAHPRAYERALTSVGGDVQAAFYLRGLAAVTGSMQWADFFWAVIETSPPFALSVIRPAPDVLELGQRKVEFAIRTWRECFAADRWPAYGTALAWANAPEWEIARWLEREAMEAA